MLVADTDHPKLKEFFDDLLSKEKTHNTTIASLGKEYAMPMGENRIIAAITFPTQDKDTVKHFEKILYRFDIIIEYESIYREKHKLSSFEDENKLLLAPDNKNK